MRLSISEDRFMDRERRLRLTVIKKIKQDN